MVGIGGGAVVEVAARWDEGGRAVGRIDRDAARAFGPQVDGGEDCPTDVRGIAQLMRLGWFRQVRLQVAAGAGGAGASDSTRARAGETA